MILCHKIHVHSIHSLRKNSIFVNTLRVQTMFIQKKEKFQDFSLKRPPSSLSGFKTGLNMLCLREFCNATNPDDDVEKFSEVIRMPSKCRKHSPLCISVIKKSVFVPVNFLMKSYDVWMKLSWIFVFSSIQIALLSHVCVFL